MFRISSLALLALCCCQITPAHVSRKRQASTTPGYVSIKAGAFQMGSPEDEKNRYTNESLHQVTLTNGFEIAATEITQKQFEEMMGYNPARFRDCARCPIETVSWHEAAAYTNALSAKRGLSRCYSCEGTGPDVVCDAAPDYTKARIYDCPGYRLPTDAEWEYAYRAGASTPYYSGTNDPSLRVTCSETDPLSDRIAWYCANASNRTHPVGQKSPNSWGLYDMAGNVWEWCHDRYLAVLGNAAVTNPWGLEGPSVRVARGGSWKYFSRGLRAAGRAWYKPHYRGSRHGFRPVRSLQAMP